MGSTPKNGAIAVFMAPTQGKHGTDPFKSRDRDSAAVAAWRARLASAAGQAVYRLRGLHERINANLRWRGLTRLTVRGKPRPASSFCGMPSPTT